MDEKHKARIVGLTMGLAMAMTVGLLPGGGPTTETGETGVSIKNTSFFNRVMANHFPWFLRGMGARDAEAVYYNNAGAPVYSTSSNTSCRSCAMVNTQNTNVCWSLGADSGLGNEADSTTQMSCYGECHVDTWTWEQTCYSECHSNCHHQFHCHS